MGRDLWWDLGFMGFFIYLGFGGILGGLLGFIWVGGYLGGTGLGLFRFRDRDLFGFLYFFGTGISLYFTFRTFIWFNNYGCYPEKGEVR